MPEPPPEKSARLDVDGQAARGIGRAIAVEFAANGADAIAIDIVLILLLLGALPTWPYSAGWGYYPSGGVGLVLLILIVLALF